MYNLRDKLAINAIVNIFTSEDIEFNPLPESWMWFLMNFTGGVFCSKTVVFITILLASFPTLLP